MSQSIHFIANIEDRIKHRYENPWREEELKIYEYVIGIVDSKYK